MAVTWKKLAYFSDIGAGAGVDEVARDNIVLLAFKLAIQEGLSIFKLEDGFVDEFEDETGVDTTDSLNESYNSSDDYYFPTTTELDYMEYSSDANTQAAYATNATYGTDLLPVGGGGITCSSEYSGYEAVKSCDDNTGTRWAGGATPGATAWVQIDFGSATTFNQLVFTPAVYSGSNLVKNWELRGSTDNFSSSNVLITSGQHADSGAEYSEAFAPQTYRYCRLYIIDNWSGTAYYNSVAEWSLKPISLQSYSESTIKSQGSYSLKGMATTGAVNKTLTRTIASPVNLSGETAIKFDIYSSRTGSNIKIGIHDSGGTTTETTPNITSAGAWQTVVWDISAVSNANKDAIDSIIITIANADSANTFYIDNFIINYNDITLISEPVEATEEPSKCRAVLLIEPVDSLTLNTDIKAYATLDDGSNYEQITLTDEGYFDSTKKIYAGNEDLTSHTDTTMRIKLTSHNNKALKIHGWALLWS